MFDDDDYEFDQDSFKEDSQLSVIETEKLRVLDQIEKYVELTKQCVKYQEKADYEINFRILSRYISSIVELDQLAENSNLSDDEVLAELKKIEESTIDISTDSLLNLEGNDVKDGAFDDLTKDVNNDDGSLDF